MISTKYYSFEEIVPAEYAPTHQGETANQLMIMYRKTIEKSSPVILELGTEKGLSTTVFLQACEEKNGKLVSVDIVDCSDISNSSRWQFIKSDSTDVEFILSKAPHLKDGIDILYIDSLHTRDHVEKELMGWYPYMNEQAWIFLDDVDANPRRKGNRKDNYFQEIHWDEIHEFAKEFFYANEDSLCLNIQYGASGLASLFKLSPRGSLPKNAKPIVYRKRNVLYLPLLLLFKIKRKILHGIVSPNK